MNRGEGEASVADSEPTQSPVPVSGVRRLEAEAASPPMQSIGTPASSATVDSVSALAEPAPAPHTEDEPARSDQIAQIREILVGGQMQEIERRFADLEASIEQRTERLVRDMETQFQRSVDDLARTVEELSEAVGAHSEAQGRAVQAADERLREANDLLRSTGDDLVREREERRQELVELQNQVRQQQDRVDEVVSDLDERIAKGGRQLMREIIDLRARLDQETSDIRRVTERGFATFASGTIARGDLADEFLALARRLADEGDPSA